MTDPDDFDNDEAFELRAEERARNRYCFDCRQSGGHASGCPGEEDDGSDNEEIEE